MKTLFNAKGSCAFCGRDNEECDGLIPGPTGACICYRCSMIAAMIHSKVHDVKEAAAKKSEELKANGEYVAGGEDCTCPTCLMAKMLAEDPDVTAVRVYKADEVPAPIHPGTKSVN